MKLRRTPPSLLFVLIPSICSSVAVDTQNANGLLVDTRKPPAAPRDGSVATTTSVVSPKSTRLDVGTKDAPVDGLDGKPHAGPFVDSSSESRKQTPGSSKSVGNVVKPKVENGVMNDPNRTPPKKGTTGTEGGVTEKDRDRKAQEYETGEKSLKKPDPPKEPPPLPLGEHEALEKKVTDESNHKVTGGDKTVVSDAEKPKGAAGIEKPADLPEKPHSLPHPDPINRGKDDTLSTTTAEHVGALLTDDENSQKEGVHDLIPWDSLAGSFSSIAATEIGDKTFIVAALMAMRHPRFQVFTAAYSALFIMTILSGVAGHAVGALISKRWSALVAALLFLVFGVKSLMEGRAMSPDQGVSAEMKEVEAELEEKEVDMARQANGHRHASISQYALEAGLATGTRRSRSRSRLAAPHRSPSASPSRTPSPSKPSISSAVAGVKNLLSLLLSPAWVETFSMTFVGELGDRSQIATVAMAAGQEYYWVMVGACLGHFVCTAVAVLGGSVLAGRVSMRKVTLAGGAIFVGFGIFTLYEAQQYFF